MSRLKSAFELVDRVLCHSVAEGATKLVLLGVARHHGRSGSWPALATLARYANVSERSVRRSIRVLEELGELTVEYRSGTSSRYVISVSCPIDCVIHTPDAGVRGRGDAGVRGGGTPVSGEPINEPTTTNSENVTYLNAGARDEIDRQWDALMAGGVRS